MKKKATRRSRSKYPGLDKKVNLKIRQELLDQDYIDKLSDEEKAWLSNFNEEYVSASFNHPGKKLHRTKKQRREVYNSNNARNRDIYSISKSNDMLKELKNVATTVEAIQDHYNPADQEDAIIDLIDTKLQNSKLLK